MVPELVSLSVHLVSGGGQVFFHRLLLCLPGDEPRPQSDDGLLREEGSKTDGMLHEAKREDRPEIVTADVSVDALGSRSASEDGQKTPPSLSHLLSISQSVLIRTVSTVRTVLSAYTVVSHTSHVMKSIDYGNFQCSICNDLVKFK